MNTSASEAAAMRAALESAIEKAGGGRAVGAHFHISSQAVGQWGICPPNRVLGLEKISGVSRHALRPDLYPIDNQNGAARPSRPEKSPLPVSQRAPS